MYDLKEKHDLAIGETQALQTCISCYSCLSSVSEKLNCVSDLKIKILTRKKLFHTWNSAMLLLKGISDVAVN